MAGGEAGGEHVTAGQLGFVVLGWVVVVIQEPALADLDIEQAGATGGRATRPQK